MAAIVGSRDPREGWRGPLEVTVEGVGTQEIGFGDSEALSTYVTHALTFLNGECISVPSRERSPWTVVSFDRAARKLVVRPVSGGD